MRIYCTLVKSRWIELSIPFDRTCRAHLNVFHLCEFSRSAWLSLYSIPDSLSLSLQLLFLKAALKDCNVCQSYTYIWSTVSTMFSLNLWYLCINNVVLLNCIYKIIMYYLFFTLNHLEAVIFGQNCCLSVLYRDIIEYFQYSCQPPTFVSFGFHLTDEMEWLPTCPWEWPSQWWLVWL